MHFRLEVSWGKERTLRNQGLHTPSIVSHGPSPTLGTTTPLPTTLAQDQCRLFSLPPELRLNIFEFALDVYPDVVDIVEFPSTHHLSLLRTCRRALDEAEDVFYSVNRFRYRPRTGNGHSMQCNLKRIGPARCEKIISFNLVSSSGGDAYAMIEPLRQFLPNLRTLIIEREMSIRYLNVSQWVLLAKQMQRELEKLQCLEEVLIVTPEATVELSLQERERLEKIRTVDTLLKDVPRTRDEKQRLSTTSESGKLPNTLLHAQPRSTGSSSTFARLRTQSARLGKRLTRQSTGDRNDDEPGWDVVEMPENE